MTVSAKPNKVVITSELIEIIASFTNGGNRALAKLELTYLLSINHDKVSNRAKEKWYQNPGP